MSPVFQTPEQRAAVWGRLSELARSIVDDETRAQYLGVWRARFERLHPVEPIPAIMPFRIRKMTASGICLRWCSSC
jgi:hypothetical protein